MILEKRECYCRLLEKPYKLPGDSKVVRAWSMCEILTEDMQETGVFYPLKGYRKNAEWMLEELCKNDICYIWGAFDESKYIKNGKERTGIQFVVEDIEFVKEGEGVSK